MHATIDPQKTYGHLRDKVQWALCDHCGWHWPEKVLREHNGRTHCPNSSQYKETSEMLTLRGQKYGRRLRGKEPVPKWPSARETMRGVSGVSKITPSILKFSLPSGPGTSSSQSLVLTGRNLSATDSILFSVLGIIQTASPVFSAIDAETRGNTATLSVAINYPIVPGRITPGDYDFLFNGDTFRHVIEVRPI